VLVQRAIIGLGAVVVVAGAWIGWIDGDFGTARPHELTTLDRWVYVLAVPVVLAPFVPTDGRWVALPVLATLGVVAAALLVIGAPDSAGPVWPYPGDNTGYAAGAVVSIAGCAIVLAGLTLLLADAPEPARGGRWLAAVAVGVLVVAVVAISDRFRGGEAEDAIERQIAREHRDAVDIEVICRGETALGGPNCATRVKYRDGHETGDTFSEEGD
jgi:hypothetical protein